MQSSHNTSDIRQIIWDQHSLAKALGCDIPVKVTSEHVDIDSRKIGVGDIFIGIKGENFNGNLFAADALKNGAALCIVDADTPKLADNSNILYVESALEALKKMALYKRNNFKGNVFAVTGSVGKTSTKEMLKAALACNGTVYASLGNFNNHYGLPLTLSNMPDDIDNAVFELGMSSAGEIAYLSNILRPNVAIITNVEAVHLEFFDSVADIAKAKSEIFDGMEKGGYAIINLDSPHYDVMYNAALAKELNIITFGEGDKSQFRLRAYNVENAKSKITATCNSTVLEYSLQVHGKHQVINSLAVLAAVSVLHQDLEKVEQNGLINFVAQSGRGQSFENEAAQITIFDETYNASPAAMKASIITIGERRQPHQEFVAILGDMKELGDKAVELHVRLLDHLIAARVNKVFCVGPLMKRLFYVLPDDMKGEYTDSADEMASIILDYIATDDVILVKGSRSMNMEKIVDILKSYEP